MLGREADFRHEFGTMVHDPGDGLGVDEVEAEGDRGLDVRRLGPGRKPESEGLPDHRQEPRP